MEEGFEGFWKLVCLRDEAIMVGLGMSGISVQLDTPKGIVCEKGKT